MKLTERDLAPLVGLQDFIHVVLVNDHSQHPDGSSYKARIQQVLDLAPKDITFTGTTNYIQKLDANKRLTNSSLIEDDTKIQTSLPFMIGDVLESITYDKDKITIKIPQYGLAHDIFFPYPATEGDGVSLVSGEQVNQAIDYLDSSVLHKNGDEIKNGTLTATTFVKSGGTSSQFLKADGSVDENDYLTSFPPNIDTLQTVTDRGNSTTVSITANSFVKSGGTPSQFLKADGSVDTNPYTTGIFQQDITVSLGGGKTMGKYSTGQVIPAAGKTFEQVIRDIAIEYVAPTFGNTFSVSTQTPSVEVGTIISGSQTFTWGITLNSGTVPTIDIFDNTAGSTLLAGTPNDGSQDQIITTKQLNANGAQQSWKGIGNNTNPIGTFNSGNYLVTAYFYRFWAPVPSYPTNVNDGVGNRTYAFALSNKAFKTNNTFTLATGTIQNKFIVLLPPTITITSVVDQTNANTDVTSSYILSTITINDAGGTARTYNMYQYTTAIPYTVNANHFITTT